MLQRTRAATHLSLPRASLPAVQSDLRTVLDRAPAGKYLGQIHATHRCRMLNRGGC